MNALFSFSAANATAPGAVQPQAKANQVVYANLTTSGSPSQPISSKPLMYAANAIVSRSASLAASQSQKKVLAPTRRVKSAPRAAVPQSPQSTATTSFSVALVLRRNKLDRL